MDMLETLSHYLVTQAYQESRVYSKGRPIRILVALDFSLESPFVLSVAERLAERTGAGLLLVHVAGFRDPLRQRPPVLQTGPLTHYARAITKIPADRVESEVLEGDPVLAIVAAAEKHACPMIIMGRGGSGPQPGPIARGVQQAFQGKIHFVTAPSKGSCHALENRTKNI